MMNAHYIIWAGDGSWRVGCADEDGKLRIETVAASSAAAGGEGLAAGGHSTANMDWTSLAQTTKRQLAGMGYVDQPVMLAVPSQWCLCARISTRDMERGHRQLAIGFRLEEHLPISAEDMIADYVDLGDGEALGVCGEYAKLRAIVDAMETADICVRHICPQAMLVAGFAVAAHPRLDVLLIGPNDATGHSTGYDWIGFERGKPASWSWLADDNEAIGHRLAEAVKQSDQRLQVAVVGDDQPTRDIRGVSERLDRLTLPTSPGTLAHGEAAVDADQAAATQAGRLLDEHAAPWVDFRCDKLAAADQYDRYRRSLTWLAAAVALLLVSVIGVTQWRAARYAHQRRQFENRQAEFFKQALPGQRVPVYVKGRLQNEQRKLAGLGGAESNEATHAISALVHLQRVLSGLPADVPFRILDLSIEPDLIRVDGQAAGHVEAERLIASLRQSGMYDVDSPKTQSLKDGGVSFLFTAKPHTESTGKGATP